ncbi:hypothetical protein [Sporosarcina trichiuri]|uniref:hypothetical protein n=1 Tax=Sporosarcina trichiuri TaxID=3056445 RepID=UPI0025B4BDD9|nr:hypothetical protein [Sporosarcina sp. 0.2-SM1T-5]WJY26387.1 hypothetical protein QWT68_09850 [Sporosarcina sp. 0.2-SM1T-5]
MRGILEFISKIFSGVEPLYWFKSYFFSAVLMILCLTNVTDEMVGYMPAYIIICGIFFPLASIVWDDLVVNTLGGGPVLAMPIVILLLWKLLKLFLLFFLTPLLAPIGVIYIYVSNGHHREA